MTEDELIVQYGNLRITQHDLINKITNSQNPSANKKMADNLMDSLVIHRDLWREQVRFGMVALVNEMIDHLIVVCRLKGVWS